MRRNRWAGFTLSELMTVMGMIAVLMALLAVFFSATLKAQRQAALRQRQRSEFVRLDGILRTDAHAATRFVVKSPTDCDLTNEQGERWTYRATGNGLVRERWERDRLRQRETFFLRPGMTTHFSTRTEQERTLLWLELDLPSTIAPLEAKQQNYHGEVLIGGALSGVKVAEVQP